ncbi:MAG TPA: VOC family protein [Pseudomonadales bacterium]
MSAIEIVIDSLHPARLARFWAEALPGYRVREYVAEEIARLAARGLTPETDPSVAVDGAGPTLWFQQTERPKTERNRIHLDLRCRDRAAERARLTGLGARVRDEHPHHTVMLDPEGNEFCLVDAAPDDHSAS